MNKLNFLVAYPYFKENLFNELKKINREKIRIIIDSGAFTAWNTGKKIDLDDYCKFLDSIECLRPFNAVQLDVFGNPEKSYDNFLTMKKRGYDVMPVFTRGESKERLDQLYNYTDYIMFGGIVIGGKNKNYVKWFLNTNKNRKAHWLGFVNMPFIKVFKPESVDSSSWTSTGRFGNLGIYDHKGNVINFKRGDFSFTKKLEESVYKLKIEKFVGLLRDGAAFRGWSETNTFNQSNVKGLAQFITSISHMKRAFDVEQKYGTKVYLACNSVKAQYDSLFDSYKHLTGRSLYE